MTAQGIESNQKFSLDGILQLVFISTKSILTSKENYLKSGQRFVQQIRTKIVALYTLSLILFG